MKSATSWTVPVLALSSTLRGRLRQARREPGGEFTPWQSDYAIGKGSLPSHLADQKRLLGSVSTEDLSDSYERTGVGWVVDGCG